MPDLQLRRYANTAPVTNLDGAITASAPTLTVNGASGFPPVPFTIKIESEIMQVTDVTGLVFTVDRAFDNSLPAAGHGDNSEVKHVLTEDDFNHRNQDVIHTPPFNQHDDEFDDNSDALTKVSLGSATWTEDYGVQSVVFSGQAVGEVSASIKSIALAGIGEGVETTVRVLGASNDLRVGPLFSSGGTTTDSMVWQHIHYQPDSGQVTLKLRSGTFLNAATEHFTDLASGGIHSSIYMRLVWVSVNAFRAWWSIDGVGWTDFGKGTIFVTGVNPPTRFGLGVSAWGSGTTDKLASFDYLRIWAP